MQSKLLSGRFLFTMAAAGVFVYASVVGRLTPETITAIIMFVVQAYFNKNYRQTQGEIK